MKKLLCFILASIIAAFSPCALYAATASGYGAPNGLTGGCDGCLDKIDGSALVDGSLAIACNGSAWFTYRLDATNGSAESIPDIISPDTNAGNKRWIKQTPYSLFATEDEAIAGVSTSVGMSPYLVNATISARGALLPPTLIPNAQFRIASRSTVATVGSQITLSDVTAGVCTTANTQGLAVGDLFKFDSGDLNGKYGVVTNLTVNTSFTLSDTSLTDSGAPGAGYEVTVAFVAADTYAFDGHSKTSTLDVHRDQGNDGTYYKGLYGAKLTKGADSAEYYNLSSRTDAAWYKQFAGRTVAMGCWVYSVSAADNVKVQVNDSAGAASSDFVPADTLAWVEIARSVGGTVTSFTPRILLDGDTADVAYISPPMLAFASVLGEGNFVPQVGEIINCEAMIASQNWDGKTGLSSSLSGYNNIVADSAGKIGSGCSAVQMITRANDAASAAGNVFITAGLADDFYQAANDISGIVNDVSRIGTGWASLNTLDNLYHEIASSGTGTLDISIWKYTAVQVR